MKGEKHPIITQNEEKITTQGCGQQYSADTLVSPTSTSTTTTDNQIGEILELTAANANRTAAAAASNDVDDLDDRIRLTWRSWIVVLVAGFALLAQVFVVTAAGSVIAFIVRDLGDVAVSGWVIRKYLSAPTY